MSASKFRLPAEWEPQAAVLVAWPHAGTDWAPRLAEVERTCVALACAISNRQPLIICVADADLGERARFLLGEVGANTKNLRFVQVPYDDTWLRDSGPITLTDDAGHFRLDDFRFTGWGGKFGAERDDALVGELVKQGIFGAAEHQRLDWALEGGAIESDGAGTVLTTWKCLEQRHPQRSRESITATLRDSLSARRVLGLEHGYLLGDDTDAHIDTLARLAPHEAIVFQACDDTTDPHHDELSRMRDELAALRTLDGRAYTLHALPWAQPIMDAGRRLAASYANYLVINGAVLVPAYDDPADAKAAAIIGQAHPGREVVQIPCRALIWQNGSLHCMTMQLPAGVLA